MRSGVFNLPAGVSYVKESSPYFRMDCLFLPEFYFPDRAKPFR